MTNLDSPTVPRAALSPLSVQWSAVIAGAIAAAGLSLVLHSFAAAVGLGVSSTAPTWRDASFALVFLSGLYPILAAVASYGFGGYIAGRIASRFESTVDAEFRDGMHGILMWALATLLTGLLALAAAQSLPRLAAPSGGSSGPSTSVGGENLIAYDLDRLFRTDRRPPGDITYARSEAGRILLTTASHRGMLADDRAHLVRLVAATTGLSAADADARVTDVSARAKENLTRARRSAVLIGFMLGAAALVGAVAAWFAACAAGRHRDGREAVPEFWDWGRPYVRR
jgi:hypothetical protein